MRRVRDLDLLRDYKVLYNKKIVIYGAGGSAENVIYNLKGLDITKDVTLCDSDKSKEGKKIAEITIESWESIKGRLDDSYAIIVGARIVKNQEEIVSMLIKELEESIPIYTIFGLESSIIFNLNELPNNDFKEMRLAERELSYLSYNKLGWSLEKYRWDINVQRFFTFTANEPEIILVYASPKTGTCTVHYSLLAKGGVSFHAHELSDQQYLPRGLDRYLKQRKVKIISLVREPLARYISSTFHFLGSDSDKFMGENMLVKQFGKHFTFDSLFQRKLMLSEFQWFDQEIKQTFGIDVYEYPFDREKGYSIIEKDNVSVLLMRMENLSSLEQVIADFTGITDFKLNNSNEGKNKEYRYAYSQFMEEYKLPKSWFDFSFGDERIYHFYTEDEVEKFKEKWRSHIAE